MASRPQSAQDRIEGAVAPKSQHAVGVATGMVRRPSRRSETRSQTFMGTKRRLAQPAFELLSRLWGNSGST
jgi:hypothetical protein